MEANHTANKEAAVEILAGLITSEMENRAAQSILHAIYYLRSGRYPFNRVSAGDRFADAMIRRGW